MKPTLTVIMPTLPAALVSNSVQIGCMTTTTFVQAVAGGLDLVAIAGGAVVDPTVRDTALVARAGSNIHAAKDLVGGPKVGVPGLGAYFHVILSYWLQRNGVDPKQVHFVETPFPAMRDMLASKTVDAVGAVDPVLTLIVNAKVGYTVGDMLGDLPPGKSILVYAATRQWAEAHRKEVDAFRRRDRRRRRVRRRASAGGGRGFGQVRQNAAAHPGPDQDRHPEGKPDRGSDFLVGRRDAEAGAADRPGRYRPDGVQ